MSARDQQGNNTAAVSAHPRDNRAVYGRAARLYYRAGFPCPLPLPPGRKDQPPHGYTGRIGYRTDGTPRLVMAVELKHWEREHAEGNICLRLVNEIGIDVDGYDGRVGGEVFAAMEAELGALPPTYISTARDDGISGIRLFTLPAGVRLTRDAEARIVERFGRDVDGRRISNIDIIREDHRYMVVWPSVHPDTGTEYGWSFDEAPLFDEVPVTDRVPMLPDAWVRFLTGPAEKPKARPKARTDGVRDLEPDDDDDADDLETPNSGERAFDDVTAQGIIRRQLKELSEAPRSRINDTLNEKSYYLYHFAPAFIDEKVLARKLLKAQERAWIASGGDDDQDYTAAQKTIRGARAAARASWTAVLADADDETPDPLEALAGEADGGGEDAAGEESSSTKKVGIFFLDARFSELVAEVLRESGILHTHELGWMRYDEDEGRWVRTSDDAAMEIVRRWVLKRTKIAKRAVDEAPEHTPLSELKHMADRLEAWRTMCSRTRRSAVVGDARAQVTVEATIFDCDPDVLNTPSGVVDLRTGELREHDRELYFTKITRAPYYGSGYTHDLWDKALSAVPEDALAWVQMFMGQGVTGRPNTEGRLLLLDGGGNNGKGALTNEGCIWTLGDFAVVLSENLLLANSSQHPTEKMALRGARMTLIDETPEARRLDTQRLKKLLDQPVLPGARFLYREEMRVELVHTMIVSTNYVPSVTEYDWGTWRRLVRLRMPVTFRSAATLAPEAVRLDTERLADPELKIALKEDGDVQAACLAWLVRGAVKWYAGGRNQPLGEEPERIKGDTKAWRVEGDLIMLYFDTFLEADRQACVRVAEMFEHFTSWCEGNGHKPWSIKTFRSRVSAHEVFRDSGAYEAGALRGTDSRWKITHPPEKASAWGRPPAQFSAYVGLGYRDDDASDTEDLFSLDESNDV